jgi:hypothetical protein
MPRQTVHPSINIFPHETEPKMSAPFRSRKDIMSWILDVHIQSWWSVADDLDACIKARRAKALMVQAGVDRYVGDVLRPLPERMKCEVRLSHPLPLNPLQARPFWIFDLC